MIIEPLKDENGNILTNVKMIHIFYEKLKDLRDGIGCKTEKEKEKSEDRFYNICGGSKNANELMEYMKQIVDEPDEEKAQRLFARSLQPIETKR